MLFLLLLLSQGTPCILAGDEFGNTQDGNNNVYCQDNETAWLNWGRQKSYEDLFRFVKRLIALRKSNPVFHQRQALLGLDRTACGIPDVSLTWSLMTGSIMRQTESAIRTVRIIITVGTAVRKDQAEKEV